MTSNKLELHLTLYLTIRTQSIILPTQVSLKSMRRRIFLSKLHSTLSFALDIKFRSKPLVRTALRALKVMDQLMSYQVIIEYHALRYKCTLVLADTVWEEDFQSIGLHLGNHLLDYEAQAYWPIVRHVLGLANLGISTTIVSLTSLTFLCPLTCPYKSLEHPSQ